MRIWRLACGAPLFLLGAGCATTAPLSGTDYVPGPAYHLIMAEIAASRGAQAAAAQEYLRAAEGSDDPEASKRAAGFAFEYGFDAYALRAARRWAQLAPDDTTAHMYLVRLLTRRNDVPAAAREANRALGDPAARAETDFLLFASELEQEDDAEAVTKVLTRVANDSPESPALQLALGTAALRSKDFDLALESAQAALAGTSVSELASAANTLIGRTLFARGDGAAAIDWVARQVEAKPSLEVELEYARLLGANGQEAKASSTLDDLVIRYGPEPAIQRLRALLALDSGDQDAAVRHFRQLAREGHFGVESVFYLAGIAERQERFDEALDLYSRIPEGAYLLPSQLAMARIAERRGESGAALEQLSQLAGRYPQLAFSIHRYQATVLERTGREEEALDLLSYDLAYRPDDIELLLARGALFDKLGQLERSLTDLGAAVEVAPDNPVALNALGYTLANRTGRHGEAYRLIRRALEREPKNAAIQDSYGWIFYRQGLLGEARSYLQLAWSQFPDPEIAAHLGEVMWKQGDHESARRLWADALEKNPASQSLKDTMSRFLPQLRGPPS
jgi:tetratricopeptide (TPR) repeat protein